MGDYKSAPRIKNVLRTDNLLIHLVPKVGTSSITRALKRKPIIAMFPEEEAPKDSYRFMVVRHPLDRIVSFWAFFCLERRGGDLRDHDLGTLGYHKNMTFESCLKILLKEYDKNHHSMKQVVFKGPAFINHLVKLENLPREWKVLQSHFDGLDDIGFFHRTDHAAWHSYYKDPVLKREAEETFKYDIDLFEKAL